MHSATHGALRLRLVGQVGELERVVRVVDDAVRGVVIDERLERLADVLPSGRVVVVTEPFDFRRVGEDGAVHGVVANFTCFMLRPRVFDSNTTSPIDTRSPTGIGRGSPARSAGVRPRRQ